MINGIIVLALIIAVAFAISHYRAESKRSWGRCDLCGFESTLYQHGKAGRRSVKVCASCEREYFPDSQIHRKI